MKKATFLGLFILLFVSQSSYSQRVKYKDLFILLNSKKYQEAEPFLRSFVSDPKNDEHANARLHMAMMFEFKANHNDLLTQNEMLVNNIDSALYFFGIAKGMIDERELKKNDNYYQSYSRRDLRTGKFAIKLSDVHFDIENRVKALNDQRQSVAKIYYHFTRTEIAYKEADSIFLTIQEKFSNQNNLLLKSKPTDLENLGLLSSKFDSTRYHFNSYKTNLEKFPESSYNQSITLVPVTRLEEEVIMATDWKKDDIKVRNYREWADGSMELINGEVARLKENLITYNNELDELTAKALADSMSVESELADFAEQMLSDDIKKFDSNPLPLAIFNFKIKRLEYYDLVFKKDTSQVFMEDRIPIINQKIELANEASTLGEAISQFDVGEESEKYESFVESLGGNNGISTLVVDGQREMNEQVEMWNQKTEELVERMRWGIAQSDSVSLVPEEVQGFNYHTLVVQDSIADLKALVFGFTRSDSTKYFMAKVSRNYEIKNLFTFEMDPFIDSLRNEIIPISQVVDTSNMYSSVYIQKSDTLARMDLSLISGGEIVWTAHLDVPGTNFRFRYVPEDRETEIYATREDNESLVLTLDAEGKAVQLVEEEISNK